MQQFANIAIWAQSHIEVILFYVLAAMAIPFAYGVILDKVIIRSGFLLIGVFGAISGLFMLLQAPFLALAQIMIYAVGITLVVVIALMLTNPRMENEMNPSIQLHRGSAILISFFVFLTIYLALRSEPWQIVYTNFHLDNIKVLGYSLMTAYALPFEFASILLLVALIGAIMLAKSDNPNIKSGEGAAIESVKQGVK